MAIPATPHLFEGHEHLLSLAEVSEEQVEGFGHQWRVVMHGQVEENPQERTAAMVIQVQWCVLLTSRMRRRMSHTRIPAHTHASENIDNHGKL